MHIVLWRFPYICSC